MKLGLMMTVSWDASFHYFLVVTTLLILVITPLDAGKILAIRFKMYMDGGAASDGTLGDMDMAML